MQHVVMHNSNIATIGAVMSVCVCACVYVCARRYVHGGGYVCMYVRV